MDSPRSSGGASSSSSSSSTKLQNKSRKDKLNVSYCDLHSERRNDVTKTPSGICRNKHCRNEGFQKEELVKYMSKLPSFLEKGEKVKAKTLNLGVLDWKTLENWRDYHPQRPSSRYSTSRSITSSSLWTNRSSNHFDRSDDTCSPRGLKGHRPSLHSYLNISPIECHSKDVESRTQNVANFTDIKAIPTNSFDRKHNIPRELVFQAKSSELKLRKCKRESLESPKTSSSTDFQTHGVLSSKGKLKVQADASKHKSEKLQNQYKINTHHGFSYGYNDVVLPRPGDSAESNQIFPFNLKRRSRRSRELTESISSDGFHFQEIYGTDPYPSISALDGVTRESNGSEGPRKEQKSSCSPSCATKSVSQETSNILEEKSSMISIDPLTSLEIRNMKSTISDSEAQNPSPSCRLSSVLNRIRRKNYHSRDSSDVLQLNSEDVIAKSGSQKADSFVCPYDATSGQANAGSRDHFSTLKRLLNPLLKTKISIPSFSDHSPRSSTSTPRFSSSKIERRELSAVDPVKVKLDFSNSRTPNLDESNRDKIQGSSTLQAYFQVSAKDDCPLFTLAIDNNSDALAATMRKFSSRKNDLSWIYTFFSVHEMKRKKGGWLNQGSRVKDYVPNVVAQMKVSDLPFSGLGEHLSGDQMITREFVLYAIDLRLYDHQICDAQPNDELLAIVVKFPRKIVTDLKVSSHDLRVLSNSRDLQEKISNIGNQELFSTTVLLPGGIHGLPSKGEPSPLIERWFSGGQCDCGGWDLGCKLKVLGNNNQKPNGHFEIFSQSREKAKQASPCFRLSSLKNGIFSVEFDSTLSLLQAFSICIAVFDSMKPSELQQPTKLFEEKLSEEVTSPDDCGLRTTKLAEVDVPARFASQLHHTPAERV